MDSSGSEDETPLVAGGWTAVTVGSLLGSFTDVWRLAPAVVGHGRVVRAGLQMAGGDDLLPVPNPDGEGAWSALKTHSKAYSKEDC